MLSLRFWDTQRAWAFRWWLADRIEGLAYLVRYSRRSRAMMGSAAQEYGRDDKEGWKKWLERVART